MKLAIALTSALALPACQPAPPAPQSAAAPAGNPSPPPILIQDGQVGSAYADREGRFALQLPPGVRLAGKDPQQGEPLFDGAEVTFKILYYPRDSADANLAGLMSVTEQAMKAMFPALEPDSRSPLQAGNAPGELAVFRTSGEQAGQRPFCGCVVFEAGGICLAGNFHHEGEAAVRAIEASMETIRGSAPD